MNMTSAQLYLRLLGYTQSCRRAFAASILGMAVTAATEPLLPGLPDGTFVRMDDTLVRLAPLFILAIFFVRGAASFAGTHAIG